MLLVFNTTQQQQNPLTLGRFEWKSIGIEVYEEKARDLSFYLERKIATQPGWDTPALEIRLAQINTAHFGLYLSLWFVFRNMGPLLMPWVSWCCHVSLVVSCGPSRYM